jgi:hypothetical protein
VVRHGEEERGVWNNTSYIVKLVSGALAFILVLPALVLGIEGDITADGVVDWADVNLLCEEWLFEDCSADNWCSGADIDESNGVDFADFALLTRNWLKYDLPIISSWLLGCIHYHTTNSDGRLSLESMVAAYRDGGDDWTCVTDHDYISDANQYSSGSFLVINGVEATAYGPHVVGLGMSGTGWFYPGCGLQEHINNVVAGGGLPIVAHPHWTDDNLGYHNIVELMSNMTGCKHIEVYNHFCQLFWGNGNSESYWDQLLSAGKVIYGTVAEDAHDLWETGYTYNAVGARGLNVGDIKTAIENGDSYICFSACRWGRGISITDYNVTGRRAGDSISIQTDTGETIQFLGNGGNILKMVDGNQASYSFGGAEKYVRVKVTNYSGDVTWTQPVFVESR